MCVCVCRVCVCVRVQREVNGRFLGEGLRQYTHKHTQKHTHTHTHAYTHTTHTHTQKEREGDNDCHPPTAIESVTSLMKLITPLRSKLDARTTFTVSVPRGLCSRSGWVKWG